MKSVKTKYISSILSFFQLSAALLMVISVLASCTSDANDVEEYLSLTIESEAPVELESFYGSYEDGHLYLSARKTTVSSFKFSLFGYNLGQTGTFKGEDYHTSTDCVDLQFDGTNYTSGEYTGDNPESFSIITIDESGEVIKGSAEGMVESWQDPNQTLNFTAEFMIKPND